MKGVVYKHTQWLLQGILKRFLVTERSENNAVSHIYTIIFTMNKCRKPWKHIQAIHKSFMGKF